MNPMRSGAAMYSFYEISNALIPAHVWDEAQVREKQDSSGEVIEYHRMDILWSYLENVKDTVTGQLCFLLLTKVAKLVLTLAHTSADKERVFSLIRKNKTDFRSSLSLDGTLSSLLTIKMAIEEPCHKYEPPSAVIKRSKKATWKYK